jgi:amidase
MSKPSWRTIVEAKKAQTNAKIPIEWQLPSDSPFLSPVEYKDATTLPAKLLSGLELEITETPTEKLLENLKDGVWSSVDVTKAFCHRAAIAHQLVCPNRCFFSRITADRILDNGRQIAS